MAEYVIQRKSVSSKVDNIIGSSKIRQVVVTIPEGFKAR